MMAEPKNREERRAKIWTRPAAARTNKPVATSVENLRSNIKPISDPLDELLKGVPFAARDEDLIAPGPKDTTVEYKAIFDRQRCIACGAYVHIFGDLLELRGNGMEIPVARIPANVTPRIEFSTRITFVPICTGCGIKPLIPTEVK